MVRRMRAIGIVALVFATGSWLAGCAEGTALITGTKRPSISADDVTIYLVAPDLYEAVGVVSASSEWGWDAQGSLDYAVGELKNQAAKIGANGIILKNSGETPGSFYGTFIPNGFGGGTFIGGSEAAQAVSGTAIYVPQ